jgi:SAM-dependent methyltransferase
MDYNKTFETRGAQYTYAVETYPDALSKEFKNAIDICGIQETDVLLNIQAGGVPLKPYFTTQPSVYHEYETNTMFANLSGISLCTLSSIPLEDESCSKILSLASLHHATQEERREFYKESWRLLKPGGRLVIGDVCRDSDQARWLNIFVDANNSSGHCGLFWSQEDVGLLEAQGFQIQMEEREYPWSFSSRDSMIDFCKNLFGLNLASEQKIQKGLESYLHATDGGFMWKLVYFIATKPLDGAQLHESTSESLLQG